MKVQTMRKSIATLLNRALNKFGLRVIRTSGSGANRPIGDVRMFLEHLRAMRVQVQGIIDVGANRGDWTRMALEIFPESKYLLIEPQQEMAQSLAALRRQHANVDYILAGAGRKEGELVQTIYKDTRGSTFLPPEEARLIEQGMQRRTQIVTLDAALRARDIQPDLIKLDIQGFELEALHGATSCFGLTEIFIVETSFFPYYEGMPTVRTIIEFMGQRGYEPYDITGYLLRPLDNALGQIDVAFARRAGALRRSAQWSRNRPELTPACAA